MKNIVNFAHDILAMQRRIEELEFQVERLLPYEAKYHQLIDEGIQHSQQMLGGILKLAMTPGVMDAISANNQVSS